MDANTDNMITAGMLSMLLVVMGAVFLCRHLNSDTHRYANGIRKALKRLERRLHRAIRMPVTSTNLFFVEHALSVSLNKFEDITGKVDDDTVRAQLELSFMVVKADQLDYPIRICVDDLIFDFAEGCFNQQAVLDAIHDFNNGLTKLSKL
jgi:hypothetical protein